MSVLFFYFLVAAIVFAILYKIMSFSVMGRMKFSTMSVLIVASLLWIFFLLYGVYFVYGKYKSKKTSTGGDNIKEDIQAVINDTIRKK